MGATKLWPAVYKGKVNLVLFSFISKIAYLADGLFKYNRALFIRGVVLRDVVLGEIYYITTQ